MKNHFFRKDYEDAFKHIDEILDISKYFNVLNISRDVVLLMMLPVTLTGTAKLAEVISTWKYKNLVIPS